MTHQQISRVCSLADGRECRAPFTCANRLDEQGNACKCSRSVGRQACQVCDYGAQGVTCVRCTGGKVSRGTAGLTPFCLPMQHRHCRERRRLPTSCLTRTWPASLDIDAHLFSRTVPSQRHLCGRLRRSWLHRRGQRWPRVQLSSQRPVGYMSWNSRAPL